MKHSIRSDFSRRKFLKQAGIFSSLVSVFIWRSLTAGNKPIEIKQPSSKDEQTFIKRAFEKRKEASQSGDQPYGAIVVKNGVIVGQSASKVMIRNDPTAHAEMEAIRDATQRLGNRDLNGCTLYSSSRACPMCESAAYWANIDRMVYGKTASDAGQPTLCG